MRSSVGEPVVELIEVNRTENWIETVCRFSEPYSDPVAPGALYACPGSGEPVAEMHRLVKASGLHLTFRTYDVAAPEGLIRGGKYFYRGWWLPEAMNAASDLEAEWVHMRYPNDGSHEHCVFTWETISSYSGERFGYFAERHGWITESAHREVIVRDRYHLRVCRDA